MYGEYKVVNCDGCDKPIFSSDEKRVGLCFNCEDMRHEKCTFTVHDEDGKTIVKCADHKETISDDLAEQVLS